MPHPITYQQGFVDPLSDREHFKQQRLFNVIAGGSRGRVSVATRSAPNYNGLSSGTDTSVTYRLSHVAMQSAADLQVAYGNWYPNNDDTVGPNDITIAASLEDANGNIYVLTFNGQQQVTIKPGGTVWSDPIGMNINRGDTFYSRSYVSVASGAYFPLGTVCIAANNEGKTTGNITQSGAYTTSTENSFCPLSIVGTTNPQVVPNVAMIGDSIMCGQGDPTHDYGFMRRALEAKNIPYVVVSKYDEDASGFQGLGARYRLPLLEGCTHAVCEFAVNDLRANVTLAQIQASLQTIWDSLVLRGMKVYQTTITPDTGSTDSWTTLANQTATTTDFGGTNTGTSLGTCVRTQLNDWIRTTPAPLSGYFEVADTVESSRNSGLWKTSGITVDGTHPNGTGHQLMSAAIDTDVFSI